MSLLWAWGTLQKGPKSSIAWLINNWLLLTSKTRVTQSTYSPDYAKSPISNRVVTLLWTTWCSWGRLFWWNFRRVWNLFRHKALINVLVEVSCHSWCQNVLTVSVCKSWLMVWICHMLPGNGTPSIPLCWMAHHTAEHLGYLSLLMNSGLSCTVQATNIMQYIR